MRALGARGSLSHTFSRLLSFLPLPAFPLRCCIFGSGRVLLDGFHISIGFPFQLISEGLLFFLRQLFIYLVMRISGISAQIPPCSHQAVVAAAASPPALSQRDVAYNGCQ